MDYSWIGCYNRRIDVDFCRIIGDFEFIAYPKRVLEVCVELLSAII
jgi:hypothetical protein